MSADPGTVELNRSFRRGFTLTFTADLVTKAVSATTVVVLVRGLTVPAYAYTTLFLALAQFAGSAAGGGVRTRYLREAAENLSRGADKEQERGQFLISLGKSTMLVTAFGLCALPVVALLHLGAKFGAGSGLILYAVAFAAGYGATELAIAHRQARRRFAAAGILTVTRASALLAAAILISLTRADVQLLSIGFVASMVVVGAATATPIAMAGAGRQLSPRRVLRFEAEESWLSLYYLAAAGFAYVDVLVVSALLDQRQVASFGAALRYLAIVIAAIPSLGAILRVRTAQADMIDSHAAQRVMILGWMRRAALPVAGALLVLVAAAPLAIPIVDGGRYPGSITVFQIFLATAASSYLVAPAVSVMMAQKRYRALALMFFVALVINLLGDVLVARRFGGTGIAVVSATVYVVLDVALTVTALRYAAHAAGGARSPGRAARAVHREAARPAAPARILQMAAASLLAVGLALAVAHVFSGVVSSRFERAKAATRDASVDGRRWYSPQSLWNTPIAPDPRLAPNNASLVAALAQTSGVGVAYNDTPAIWYAGPRTPRLPVRVDAPRCDTRTVWVPIPAGAMPDSSSEGHMAVVQRGTGIEYDFDNAQSPNRPPKPSVYNSSPCPAANEWTAASVVSTDWETGTGEVRGDARGSGIAEGAGTILPRDTQMPAGATWDHALSAAYKNTCSPAMSWCATVAPATREDGTCTAESRCLPEGARLQLDPWINCSTWSLLTYVWQRQMCRTLQRYGVIIVGTNDGGPTIADQWWGSLIGYTWPWLQDRQLNLPHGVLSHFRVLAWQ